MELRRKLIINGVEFHLAVSQTGKGAPTAATAGLPGVLYMDEDNGALYKCTAAGDGVFTWAPVISSGGGSGENGEDGGYYTPAVTQPSETKLQFAFTPSKADMPAVQPVQVTLPAGQGSGGNADYTLPVATSETLGGVKPVTKTDAMTQPVGVDANGALYTEPGKGGGSDYVLPVGGAELGGVKNGGNVTINEDGTMTAPEPEISDEQISTAVDSWLDEHPEATTTVADGSINPDKTTWMRQVFHNIFDPNDPDIKDGYYFFSDANASLTGGGTANYFATGYIPVTGGKRYYIKSIEKVKVFDEAKTFISTISPSDGIVEIPVGAEYMRFSTSKGTATLDTVQVYEYIGEDWEYDTYKNLYAIVMTDPGYAKAIADMVEGKFLDGSLTPDGLFAEESIRYKKLKGWDEFHWNIVDPETVTRTMPNETHYRYSTDFIKVEPGMTLIGNYIYKFYDENKEYVSEQNAFYDGIIHDVIVPDGVAFVKTQSGLTTNENDTIKIFTPGYGRYPAYNSDIDYNKCFPVFKDEDSKEGFKIYLGLYPWEGKNFGIIGDSLTAPGTWCNIMADNLKAANCWKKAVSGANFSYGDGGSKTAYEQAQEFVADGRTLDVILITMGTNDANNSRTMGEIVESNNISDFDLTTYTGGMQACLNYLQNNFPNAIIYVGWTPMGGLVNGTRMEYITRMQDVCLMYGVEYIETRTCGVTRFSDVYADCYEAGVNGGHPTNAGQQKIGAYMTRLMQSKL